MSGDTTSLMPIALFLSLLPAMFGFATAEQSDQVRTLVVEQEVIMRIPVRPRPVQPFAFEEKKGPKCLDASSIRGAALSSARLSPEFYARLTRDRQILKARV